MKRTPKTYRLSAETLEKIEKLRTTEPEKNLTATDIIETAIRRMDMQTYYIRDNEHAEKIIYAYNHCKTCSECILNTPEGWRCSHMYEQAQKYLEKKK